MNYFNTCLLIFIISLQASGQAKNNLILGSFQKTPFPEFVTSIEKQTSYYFYFDDPSLDSLLITFDASNSNLQVLLDSVFSETEFHFAITENNVFITKGIEIRTELPVSFFDQKLLEENNFDVAAYDLMNAADQKQRLSVEQRIYEIGPRTRQIKTSKSTLSGYIRNAATGEAIVGAVIFDEKTGTGVASDPLGFYTITLPSGRNKLTIRYVGMKETNRNIMLFSDGKLDIELTEHVTALREVVVESERGANISGTQMGIEKLDIRTMKQVPVAFGEADVLKVILTLPGVQSVGESATGLNVRGGTPDQNLVLFDDATIFNTSHLFGFFSAFNPDIIKSAELYKSGIPAEYGGRVSSVMEVVSREGNKKKFGGSGGIGLITSRLALEGPIQKGKTSFLIGGRTTYSDWLLSKVDVKSLRNSAASFHDLNLHISHEHNEKNTFDLNSYYSNDNFKLNNDTLYAYKNMNASLKWRHTFENKIYGIFTTAYSRYAYNVESDLNPVDAARLDYGIRQINAKADFSYLYKEKHTINFGAGVIHYNLQPGTKRPIGNESIVVEQTVQQEKAIESALYISDRYDVTSKLSLNYGLRYSFFNYLGPRQVYAYAPGLSRSVNTITDTLYYGKGKFMGMYQGPEYRFSLRYLLSGSSSLKVSFHRMRQYVHMLSNTTAISPTDIWKLSDPYIKPQLGDQLSIGLYKNLKSNTIEMSVEAYYKKFENFLDYKGGAVLILNEQIETDIIDTEGRAYGAEFLVKKVAGKLNGWLSYTYSRSLLQSVDRTNVEAVNRGEEYPSNFDKPHNVTAISNYRLSRRFSISLNFTYSTGRPITIPLKKYEVDGTYRVLYSDRNQFRIPDYYRADFAMNIEGNHKIKKLAHSSWSLSVYNLTGRKNAYSVFFRAENGRINGYKLAVFGAPIPTVTYNFRF